MSEVNVFDDLAKNIVKKISEKEYSELSQEDKAKYISKMLNDDLMVTATEEEVQELINSLTVDNYVKNVEYQESMYWLKGFIILTLLSFGLYTANNIYKFVEGISFMEIFGVILFIVNVVAGIDSFIKKN